MRFPVFLACALGVFAQSPANDWKRLNIEGTAFYRAGNFVLAESRFRDALHAAETFGDTDPRYWAALTNLGLTLERRGDLSGAEPILRRALQLRERSLGPDHIQVAHALVNLSAMLHLARRDEEAEELVRRALSIAEKSGNARSVAEALNSLGLTLLDMGDPARAEPVLRRAAALFEQSEGAGSLDAAKAINNLAMAYSAERDYPKAEIELRRALPLYEKNLGPSHAGLIGPLNNLFTVLAAQKRYEEGEPYLRRALDLASRENSDVVPVTQLRANLGALQLHRGQYQAAARTLEQVIASIEQTFGAGDPQLAGPLRAYAEALRHLHQRAEARRAAERASELKSSLVAQGSISR